MTYFLLMLRFFCFFLLFFFQLGWSDTPGLQKAMPSFHSSQSSMLRTTAQGADTIIWMVNI